jgi:hypothetical protein
MSILQRALEVLPSTVQNPLALIGYVFTLIAWAYAMERIYRLREVRRSVKGLPREERGPFIARELGRPIPPQMDPSDFLRMQRQRYVLIGALSVLLLVFLLSVLSIWEARNIRVQDLLNRITFSTSPSEYARERLIPLADTVTITLHQVPAGARIQWHRPEHGSLDNNSADVVRFTTDSEGAITLDPQISMEDSHVTLPIRFTVVNPISSR